MTDIRRALRLYLVTDPGLCLETGLVETVRTAVAGGVTMVQLRDKTGTRADRIAAAKTLKDVLQGTGVPLLVNDDVEAAIQADADGAHIGQDDLTPTEARALLGADKLLGLSCETAGTVQAADPTIVDYLGLGPVFATATKHDHKTPLGFDGLSKLTSLSTLPSVAIGGLGPDHTDKVLESGADGLAVVSAICGQPDPEAAARAFFQKRTQP